MNVALQQEFRLGRLETVFGPNTIGLLRFDGTDHVNGLFEYKIEGLCDDPALDFDALIGSHAGVALRDPLNEERWFDGIVTQACWSGYGDEGCRYTFTLRPWLWVAGRARQQRIFHNMTAPAIIEEVLSRYSHMGQPHLELRLTSSYPELEYTVQYGESDMAFVQRLMERFGISYHFAHASANHTMVLTDGTDSHDPIAGVTRDFKTVGARENNQGESFWRWCPERNFTTGAIRLMDYNFKTPTVAMEVDREGDAQYPEGRIESYDYPGDYLDQSAGRQMAAIRTDQERAGDRRHRAMGDCVALRSGMLVTLTGETIPGVTGDTFVCLSATHSYLSSTYRSSGGEGDAGYTGSYVFAPADAPFAPPPGETPVPKIYGPQTAVVVGDGEIDCDEYGRILVQFHWDLTGARSMRCRVAQGWAGQGWGNVTIPRIGMEVVVEFLEGDPDKPLVTGCVYNGRNGVPYDLPGNKTRTTFKSQSHQQGGYNELRFEDAGGSEEIFMHAQKDHNTVVENDESHQILNDRSKSVTRHQTETIGGNKTITVTGDHTETVDGKTTQTHKLDHSLTVTEGNQTITVDAGDQSTTVEGNQGTTVRSGNRYVEVAAGAQATSVKGDILTRSENGSIKIESPAAIILEAPNIVLKANGGNFISVSQGTVVIEGGQTLINPREAAPQT